MANSALSVNELVFPEASQNFSQVLSSLKRSKHSIKHRLVSIYQDSIVVKSISTNYGLSLVANERCGSWYIRPEDKEGSVYFKSTDGHHGQWSFNTRRLNLHLLDIIERNHGCIIVDSTRRGKPMPDALSKTIPIWCAVINQHLFPDRKDTHVLVNPNPDSSTPSTFLQSPISTSELAQINTRLPTFLNSLQSLNLPPSAFPTLTKPLQPLFLTPQTASTVPPLPTDQQYHPIILLTASRLETSDADDGYIQGAGDDTEMWAHGLSAAGFWENEGYLRVDVGEEELRGRIAEVMRARKGSSDGKERWSVVVEGVDGGGLFVGMTGDGVWEETWADWDGVVVCDRGIGREGGTKDGDATIAKNGVKCVILRLGCPTGKFGSRVLREKLPLVQRFVQDVDARGLQPRMLFVCETGKDLSIGVALAIFCLYYDEKNSFSPQGHAERIDKAFIRQRLVTMLNKIPGTNPSRSTLQSVNSFLMARPD